MRYSRNEHLLSRAVPPPTRVLQHLTTDQDSTEVAAKIISLTILLTTAVVAMAATTQGLPWTAGQGEGEAEVAAAVASWTTVATA